MSITDELRKYVIDADGMGMTHGHAKCIYAIADRIDVTHRSALEKLAVQLEEASDMREFCGRLEEAANNREDVTMWGVDYIPLPVDADGVPIHVGDKLTDGEYRFTVHELATFGDGSWSIRNEDGNAWAACDVTHHNTPTVEDVLREFADRVCNSCHQWGLDAADTIAEYAARLRLAGGDA